MTLLDRFRTQQSQKHPDAAVRLQYVAELPLADRQTIAAMAREDDDARVRKAAVAKLMDPAALAAIARDDRDEGVRAQASAMLLDIAVEAFEDVGEAESLEAVEAMVEPRAFAQVAKTAQREITALRALTRIDDPHLLGSVARHAVVESARRGALESLCVRGDRAELVATAMNSDFKDTAVAAVEAVSGEPGAADAETYGVLEQIAERGRNKSASKRARGILREVEERAAAEAAARDAEARDAAAREAAEQEARAAEARAAAERAAARDTEAREAAAEPRAAEPQSAERPSAQPQLDAAAAPPHGDPLSPELAASTSAVNVVSVSTPDATPEASTASAADAAQRHARLAELADEAAAVAAATDFAAARKRFAALRRDWQQLSAASDVDPGLAGRFGELDAQFTAREAEAREADARARREALARMHNLLGRVEPLPARPDLSLKAADRALRDIRAAIAAMPMLPTKQDYEDALRRLKAVQTALVPKVQELREADDWRRFANVAVQEQLCARMEALQAAEDPEAIAREVHELQQQWRAAADVPRAQADALWRRFKTAHDAVWPRVEAHFAAQSEERSANLAKKVALCERAEALSDSTNWIETADAIKALQAEWKTIGPVSRGKEKAIWDRFRTACDKFFRRRHDDLAERKAIWAQNLKKKDALCERAEALSQSTEWESAAAELKHLQAEWKAIGPVKKSRSEAIWHRFRAACDTFFDRYAHRHDTARAERAAAREALVAEMEALAAEGSAPDESAAAAALSAPEDLLPRVRSVRNRWQQEILQRGVDPDLARALDERFGAALNRVLAQWPSPFAGTELDPDANRKRMEALVKKMEDLAASLSGAAPVDESLSPTTRLAAMLKEALAANTIGGKPDEDSRFRAAAEDVRQAQSAWSRIGLVADDVRRPLADRFQKAIRRISERTARSAAPRGNTRKGSFPA